jgi:small subunit ribosomal protein S2
LNKLNKNKIKIKSMTKQELTQKLIDAGAHFGYTKARRHPTSKPTLYSVKSGKDIIDISKSVEQIEKAADFLAGLVKDGKQFFTVGTKPEAKEKVTNAGMKTVMPYAAERFIGGTLTNFGEIKKRVEKLHDLIAKKEKGEFAIYTKKEQVLIDRDIARMTKNFGGLSVVTTLPAAVLLVDSKFESIAHEEAKYMRLPVVSLSNTDCNIRDIKYPIVINDASAETIQIVLDYIGEKIENINA